MTIANLIKRPIMLVPALIVLFLLCTAEQGCSDTSDTKERGDVERGQAQLVQNQPAPVFDWSLEREIFIQLYKARNRATTTYHYTQSQFTGKITWECVGIGFPIAATTQLTNPMKWVAQGVTIPQAEPNGMYAPPQSDATFVPCLAPDGSLSPARIEDHVSSFFTPMMEVNGKLVPVPGKTPSFGIAVSSLHK
jgi:hypothetical protein